MNPPPYWRMIAAGIAGLFAGWYVHDHEPVQAALAVYFGLGALMPEQR